MWLDASGVSRSHARIEVERGGDAVRIEDLGSKNGTYVNGASVHGLVAIANGSVLKVGSVTLTLRVWSRGKAAQTERLGKRDDEG